jgi:hypothetical protein
MAGEEIWHLVEGKRADGLPSIFRIRELAPQRDRPKIFVVELPYPTLVESRLPDAAAYRRLATFEEQWLLPACAALDWTFVATKIEDGSAFLYVYGAGSTAPLIEKLSPFDGGLGFFGEDDPTWDEYAALRELLDEAKAFPPPPELPEPAPRRVPVKRAKTVTTGATTKRKKKRR